MTNFIFSFFTITVKIWVVSKLILIFVQQIRGCIAFSILIRYYHLNCNDLYIKVRSSYINEIVYLIINYNQLIFFVLIKMFEIRQNLIEMSQKRNKLQKCEKFCVIFRLEGVTKRRAWNSGFAKSRRRGWFSVSTGRNVAYPCPYQDKPSAKRRRWLNRSHPLEGVTYHPHWTNRTCEKEREIRVCVGPARITHFFKYQHEERSLYRCLVARQIILNKFLSLVRYIVHA